MADAKQHHRHRSDPDRTRCGRLSTERVQIAADPTEVSCTRCRQLEPSPARRVGLLRYALEAALVDADPWLRDADGATVELARHLADQLDRGDLEDATAVARQLGQLYRALGLSPDGRAQLEMPAERADTPLEQLRDGSLLRAVPTDRSSR